MVLPASYCVGEVVLFRPHDHCENLGGVFQRCRPIPRPESSPEYVPHRFVALPFSLPVRTRLSYTFHCPSISAVSAKLVRGNSEYTLLQDKTSTQTGTLESMTELWESTFRLALQTQGEYGNIAASCRLAIVTEFSHVPTSILKTLSQALIGEIRGLAVLRKEIAGLSVENSISAVLGSTDEFGQAQEGILQGLISRLHDYSEFAEASLGKILVEEGAQLTALESRLSGLAQEQVSLQERHTSALKTIDHVMTAKRKRLKEFHDFLQTECERLGDTLQSEVANYRGLIAAIGKTLTASEVKD